MYTQYTLVYTHKYVHVEIYMHRHTNTNTNTHTDLLKFSVHDSPPPCLG